MPAVRRAGGFLCILAGAALPAIVAVLLLSSWWNAQSMAQGARSCAFVLGEGQGQVPARRLTSDGQSVPVTWADDGRQVLVRRPEKVIDGQEVYALWLISTSGREAASLEQRQIVENALYVSRNGSQIAYLRFAGAGQWRAVRADLDGTDAVDLGAAQWQMPPAWVGDQVVYLPASDRVVQHARLSSSGQVAASDGQALWVEEQVIVDEEGGIGGLAWSPDGERLAYVVSRGGPMPELWVWDRGAQTRHLLVQGAMEHWGTPAWSPDGTRLAWARHATGSGGNANGDIWLIDVGGTNLHPMALTPADERFPCWSPDGRALAFSHDGDLWIADPDAPGLGDAPSERAAEEETLDTPIFALGLTAPLTIRVKHDAGNLCRPVPVGSIQVYDFEQYVRQVVPWEMPASWAPEALKAQAVAARTYAWRKVLNSTGRDFDVWDSTMDQYMCDDTVPQTNAAVDATEGQYVAHDGALIYAFFCAEAGSPTHYQNVFGLSPIPLYLRPVDDPVSFGRVRRGHSVGLSQEGARRWADQHDWNYQQILCHYYTSAAVEHSSAITEPLGSPTLPWNDFYVRMDHAFLRANAVGAVLPLTVTWGARVTDTWSAVHTAVYTQAGNERGWVWPVGAFSDTITPSIGMRLTIWDGAGQVTTSTTSYLGLDRAAPTGTASVSATHVTTLSVPVWLSGTDPMPGSGQVRASLGSDDWLWEESDFYTTAGNIVSDGAALDGRAWSIAGGETGLLFGPYTTALPAGEAYRAYFRLKVPAAALTSALELLQLDVTVDAGETLLGVRYLRGTDFRVGGQYQEFAVDFAYPAAGGELEFRAAVDSPFDLWLDRVRVVGYPQAVPYTCTAALPAREGTVTVTAHFVDRAANVSSGVPLTFTVTDLTPPGGWRGFECRGMDCTVQVRDVIAGLKVTGAAYRYSTNQEVTWTHWISAACSGVDGAHDWQTVTATLPFTPALPGWQIQFRAQDAAAAGNVGVSPAYAYRYIYLPLLLKTSIP